MHFCPLTLSSIIPFCLGGLEIIARSEMKHVEVLTRSMIIITVKGYYLIIKSFNNKNHYLITSKRNGYTEEVDRPCLLDLIKNYNLRSPFSKRYPSTPLSLLNTPFFQPFATRRTHVSPYTRRKKQTCSSPSCRVLLDARAPVVPLAEDVSLGRSSRAEKSEIAGNTWHWRNWADLESHRARERKKERERLVFAYSSTLRRAARACVCKRRR